MGSHKARYGVAGNIGTITALAESPTEFVAFACVYDTAFVGLPASASVYVPATDILKFCASLIAYLQISHLAFTHIGKTNVAFRTFRVDVHLSCLCDTGITILA